jgi:hypothetical protein
MKTSNFLSLNWLDLGKMFLLAFMTFFVNWLQTSFVPTLDVSPETRTLISVAIAYLLKNFFTPSKLESQGIIGGSTSPAEKDEK